MSKEANSTPRFIRPLVLSLAGGLLLNACSNQPMTMSEFMDGLPKACKGREVRVVVEHPLLKTDIKERLQQSGNHGFGIAKGQEIEDIVNTADNAKNALALLHQQAKDGYQDQLPGDSIPVCLEVTDHGPKVYLTQKSVREATLATG